LLALPLNLLKYLLSHVQCRVLNTSPYYLGMLVLSVDVYGLHDDLVRVYGTCV